MKETAAERAIYEGGDVRETAGEKGGRGDREGDFAKRSRPILPVERTSFRFSAGPVPASTLVSLADQEPQNRSSPRWSAIRKADAEARRTTICPSAGDSISERSTKQARRVR